MRTCIAFFCLIKINFYFEGMRNYLIATLAGLLLTLAAHSQKHRYFQITPIDPDTVAYSLYNKISLLDMREDKEVIGIIDPGSTPEKAEKYLFKDSVQQQLTAMLTALTDSTAKDGELLLQFRRFHFVETSKSRFCYLSAIVYARQADRYSRLGMLDTAIVLTGSVKALDRLANYALTQFLKKSLTMMPASAAVSYTDILNLDSMARDGSPLYTAAQYVDGEYNNAQSFLLQRPDWQGFVDTTRKGKVFGAYPLNSRGKPMEEARPVFAIVYKGVPYIGTAFGYYPIERVGREIFVNAYIRMPTKDLMRVMEMTAHGPLRGGMEADMGIKTLYRLVFDPVGGKFIHLNPL